MKIEFLKDGKKPFDWITFKLEGVDVAFANALRRAIKNEVPTLAIEDVNITQNSSALYDEVLALRIGLVPIVTDLDVYSLEGPANKVSLILKVKGPCWVYSGDLKCEESKTKVAQKTIPLTWLEAGQEIELEGVAIVGKGKVHTKWSPGIAAYSYDEKAKNPVFEFYIESHGQLSPKEMVERAADVLASKATDFAASVEKLK